MTDTPALRLIPGNAQLKAAARRRNPFGRLTTPEDVARVIHLLCLPEAAWINGEVIRVDGGEHVSGASALSLYLHGLGHFHPETEITNRFLEDLDIGTNDAWIMERVGIRSRRTVLPLDYIRETRNRDPRAAREAMLYGNAETGRRAAEMAIARAGHRQERDRHGDLGQLRARHGHPGRRLHDRRGARPRGARASTSTPPAPASTWR